MSRPAGRPAARRDSKIRRAAYGLAIVGVLALPLPGPASEHLEIAAEAEAFGMRVEYDIPVSAGPTIPHVIGEIRRTAAENAKGFAAAPNFGIVAGGTIADPNKEPRPEDDDGIPDENSIPHTECFFPGDLTDTATVYPTDARSETADVPPLSYASSQCAQGPQTLVQAWMGGVGRDATVGSGVGAVLASGSSAADALVRPVEGVVVSEAHAAVEAISIASDAITIDSVDVAGRSTATGPGGMAETSSSVTISGIEAGGQRFAVADNHLTVGEQTFQIGGAEARAFMDGVNTNLEPSGCHLTVLSETSRYPQGYLLSRKPPRIDVADDGTFASSMRGGLLVVCDIPDEASEPTTFSPQRAQILVGFVYTMTQAFQAPGGFTIGNIAPITVAPQVVTTTETVEVPLTGAVGGPATPTEPLVVGPADGQALPVIAVDPLAPSTRRVLYVLGVVGMLVVAHLASRRLRELVGRDA